MLPQFTISGDLPPGIHQANWNELEERFGRGSDARERASARIRHLYDFANRTGKLARFLVFGSFVSSENYPRDVDVVLVMKADFHLEEVPRESQTLFSPPDAEARFGGACSGCGRFWQRISFMSFWKRGR